MTAVVVENGQATQLGRHGANLVVVGPPADHQVTKANGQTLTARMSVRNDGGGAGNGRLSLAVVGIGIVAQSPWVSVGAGQTLQMTLTWSAQGLQPGANSAAISLLRENQATLFTHIFTVNAPSVPPPPPPPPPPPSGPELVALTDLQIS